MLPDGASLLEIGQMFTSAFKFRAKYSQIKFIKQCLSVKANL